MKPGAESPVMYDFIRRYTIRSYLKMEAFFTPAVQATLNDRISTVSAASRKYVLSATGYERIFGRKKGGCGADGLRTIAL